MRTAPCDGRVRRYWGDPLVLVNARPRRVREATVL